MSKQIEEVMALVDAYADAMQETEYARLMVGSGKQWDEADSIAKNSRVSLEAKLREILPVWQPIDGAKKEGCILIHSTERGVVEAYWCDSWYGDKVNQGWMQANLDEEFGSYIDDATHWMPLPKAPE